MLFLPKYGTNGVCAEARPAQPTMSHAASTGTATSGPGAVVAINGRRREGRRMRISSTSDRNSSDDSLGGQEGPPPLRTDGDLTVTFRAPANGDPGVYETFCLCCPPATPAVTPAGDIRSG